VFTYFSSGAGMVVCGGDSFGYRWYEAHNIEVAVPFGHGLSYTSFTLRDLSVTDTAATLRLTMAENAPTQIL
jgi:beta-glucosidase